MPTTPLPPPPEPAAPAFNKILVDDETFSLLKVGFLKWTDGLFAFLIFTCFMALAGWSIFGQLTVNHVVALLAAAAFFACVWTITLVYRCMYFVLQTRAAMEMLPENAARIAFQIYSVQASQPKL